jgi:hypothetical protein
MTEGQIGTTIACLALIVAIIQTWGTWRGVDDLRRPRFLAVRIIALTAALLGILAILTWPIFFPQGRHTEPPTGVARKGDQLPTGADTSAPTTHAPFGKKPGGGASQTGRGRTTEKTQVDKPPPSPVPAPVAASEGFFAYAIPNSDLYVQVSLSGFPKSVDRALPYYLHQYLNAAWHRDAESRVHQILWLEAKLYPNAAVEDCSSPGIDLSIQYRLERTQNPRPVDINGVVHGHSCYGYGKQAEDSERDATEDAFSHLRDALGH